MVVKEWEIPLLIGDERTTIEGITEFLPTADAVKAYEAAASGESGDEDGDDGGTSVAGIVAIVVGGVLAGAWGLYLAKKMKSR